MDQVTILEDSDGQLVLPFSPELLNQMGWDIGDVLLWEYDVDEFLNKTAKLTKKKIDYKFNEKNYIDEFQAYIDKTYDGHYSTNKFQSTEVIIDRGHGTGFCMGNVDKYSNRYGKKGTKEDARKDLMKILHYALIQLYIHDNDL